MKLKKLSMEFASFIMKVVGGTVILSSVVLSALWWMLETFPSIRENF